MNRRLWLFPFVLLLVVFGGFVTVVAQDTLPAVDLTIWHQEADELVQGLLQDLLDQWAEERAPGSTVDLVYLETEEQRQQLLSAGLAGTGLPDAIMGPNDPIGVYVSAGLLQPLDDLFDLSPYTPGALEPAQLDGQTYGIPYMAGNHLMLMYNRQFVDEPPQTWDELIALARQIEEENPGVEGLLYNLNEPFWLVPFVAGFGGSVFDEEGNFAINDQAWVDAFQFVHDLKFETETVPPECDIDCVNSLFQEGSAAMVINGDWAIGPYLDTSQSPALGPENLGVAPWPALPNGERPQPYVSGRYFSIPVTTQGDNLNAVVDLITYLTTDPAAVEALTIDIGRLPAVTAGADIPELQEDPILSASAEALATGTGMPANIELRCMWDAVRPQLQGVMSDSVTPEQAAADAQASAEACVADLAIE